jgi:NAD(P)-dependent dehydrogenase (short-subunit alcohol dehydrogenase family)
MFERQVVVITGASSGIGTALAQRGVRWSLLARSAERGAAHERNDKSS